MNVREKLEKFYELRDEILVYGRTLGKLDFDMQCNAPADGLERAGKDMAILGKRYFELEHSEEYVTLLCELYEEREALELTEKVCIERYYDEYEKKKNFTPEFAYELDSASHEAFAKWINAKEKADFSLYRDCMEKLIVLSRKAIELRDKRGDTIYDDCLSDYEKGGSIDQKYSRCGKHHCHQRIQFHQRYR